MSIFSPFSGVIPLAGQQQVGAIEPDRVVLDPGLTDSVVQSVERVEVVQTYVSMPTGSGLSQSRKAIRSIAQSSRKISGRSMRPSVATSSANNGAMAAFQRTVTSAAAWKALVAAGSSHS